MALDARMIAHSGIGTHVRGLLEGFRQLDAPPDLVLLGPADKLAETPEAQGFEHLAWDEPIYSIREQITFPARELRRRGVGAIHSPHYNMPLRAGGLRRLVTVHDVIHLICAQHLSQAARLYARLMFRQVARRADQIFAVSENTRDDLRRMLGVDPSRVAITYNAPGAAFAKPPPPERVANLKRRLKLPESYVLTIGINKPHKNFGFIAEVFAALWAQGLTRLPLLVMAGIPGDEAEPYRELARRAGADPDQMLRFPGKIPWEDVPALYAGAALVALPTLCEGFCLPVVEAQSLGVPVAASRASCLPEVAGEGAAFFDPRDPDDAARAILSLINDAGKRRALAEKGKANARRFSWKKTAEILAGIYAANDSGRSLRSMPAS